MILYGVGNITACTYPNEASYPSHMAHSLYRQNNFITFSESYVLSCPSYVIDEQTEEHPG